MGLTITSSERGTAELGVVIGRAHWGQGIGTAAARRVIGYAFDTLGLAEIRAEVLQRNPASVRLLEKAGFRLLRAVPGDPAGVEAEDCFLYAILRPLADTA